MSAKPTFKITYTTAGADMDAFHAAFDEALAAVRKSLGRAYPLYIDGRETPGHEPPFKDVSPIDTSMVLGEFQSASVEDVVHAVAVARAAQKGWAKTPWQERLTIMRRAAAAIRDHKFELAAIMSLEVGKSRMESMGEVEESADLIDYYSQIMQDAGGYLKPLSRLMPNERTLSILRPYGVFGVISPFNFPLALSTGMLSAALIAGNAVVFKPPVDAPWCTLKLHEICLAAGVPGGVFHYVSGTGRVAGQALYATAGVDGMAFTGSKDVGMRILHQTCTNYPRPVLMELGGKNPTLVTASADLEDAASGVMRSAFGLQGQKCSACSRVYVDRRVVEPFVAKLLEKTRAIKIGDPTERDVFLGPVINLDALETFVEAAKEATTQGGKLLTGGRRLTEGKLAQGFFAAPTIAQVPTQHPLHKRELFLPFVTLSAVSSFEEGIKECNDVEYGLTAGIFSRDAEEVERFFDEVEAGVCYANRPTGATTGAWPGVQSFTGWKGSGCTGKGGCGPYYLMGFMHEQSRTVME
jgi:1-pyrroline-5-carboxylate dehydrogenase